MMIRFTAPLQKFGKQGEKTGWTYLPVPADLAAKLKPGNKKEFKVKGHLDKYPLQRASLLPMGDGSFILPVNASMRKAIGKSKGAMARLAIEEDRSEFVFNKDLIACLEDDPAAQAFFKSLPGSHQRYFSKWIDAAKTDETKIKRITMAVNALSKKMGYADMLRSSQGKSI